jgi:hypothetical protein
MRQLLATLCVASSLTLGGSDLSTEFRLRTLRFSRQPLAIEGPVGDTTSISLAVAACTMSEE